ncbi:PaaI family thioesterase [Shewanella inventionis]|uniref:Phenylacetic acid degradation protein n=1 Tax=Shewanella inventionis TaxID=1738770 RepID=A0ABQ1JC15_9GAMM|nr:PaaI family thioesterase [Shewanella inventionis]MCL1157842.1 PaaI family thioesterase [Shewanella inventionis]UAL41598.1 PaaI family thioesterase [Shewanella inventionis]GGB63602.1 phenylacetic acid degradation protein [Shewanella inventionis]
MKHLTGLELMQAMLKGDIPPPSISETIPMKAVEVSDGKVTFEAMANERHLNPMGGVHGGFAATVLDTVTACAVHSALGAGVSYSTIDLAIKMVRPVPQNKTLIATGSLMNLSKSLGISEGRLTTEDGKLLATATASCLILRP